MPQLKVHIKPEEEDDKQEIDSLSRNLRDNLSNLNQVEEVHLSYEKPPSDSKAFDGVALGSMVVEIMSGGAIKEVTQTVQRWDLAITKSLIQQDKTCKLHRCS